METQSLAGTTLIIYCHFIICDEKKIQILKWKKRKLKFEWVWPKFREHTTCVISDKKIYCPNDNDDEMIIWILQEVKKTREARAWSKIE